MSTISDASAAAAAAFLDRLGMEQRWTAVSAGALGGPDAAQHMKQPSAVQDQRCGDSSGQLSFGMDKVVSGSSITEESRSVMAQAGVEDLAVPGCLV